MHCIVISVLLKFLEILKLPLYIVLVNLPYLMHMLQITRFANANIRNQLGERSRCISATRKAEAQTSVSVIVIQCDKILRLEDIRIRTNTEVALPEILDETSSPVEIPASW